MFESLLSSKKKYFLEIKVLGKIFSFFPRKSYTHLEWEMFSSHRLSREESFIDPWDSSGETPARAECSDLLKASFKDFRTLLCLWEEPCSPFPRFFESGMFCVKNRFGL